MTTDSDPQDLHALAPGERLDEYEIRNTLGAGGFGVVYEAYDSKLDTLVAIKEYMPCALVTRVNGVTVTPIRSRDHQIYENGLRRFIEEGKVLARFDHANIVRVYRVLEANNTAYLVMPFYRGETLEVKLESGRERWDEARIRRFAEQMLDALHTVHDAGLCHRDIAPDNILIKEQGDPMLLDFGGARRYVENHSHAMTALVKGCYSPFEQYSVSEVGGLPLGPWSDIYSMAAVLYQLVGGEKPYPATSRISNDPMLSLVERCQRKYSKGFRSFLKAVDWGLSPHPSQRPQSVEQWGASLLHGKPVPNHGVARKAETAEKTTTRWPWIFAGSSLVAGLAIALVVVFNPFSDANLDNQLVDDVERAKQAVEDKHNALKNAVATAQSELNSIDAQLKKQDANASNAEQQIQRWELHAQLTDHSAHLQAYEMAINDNKQGLSYLTGLIKQAEQAQKNHQDNQANDLLKRALAGYSQLNDLPKRLSEKRTAERGEQVQLYNGAWGKDDCAQVKTWVVDFPQLSETNPGVPTFVQRIVEVEPQGIVAVVISPETYKDKVYKGRVYSYQINGKKLTSTQLKPEGKAPVLYQSCK